MTSLSRVTGVYAAVGGAAWVAACLSLAALPEGCVGDECLTRPEREWSTTATVLVTVAFFVVAASALGLLVLAMRRPTAGRRLGKVAVAVGVAGTGLLVIGAILQALDVPGMGDAMPGFVIPGVLLCVVAAALTAWVVLRARLVPAWLAVVVGVAAALMLTANEQDDSILFAAPFGVAWLLVGGWLLLDRVRPSAPVRDPRREVVPPS